MTGGLGVLNAFFILNILNLKMGVVVHKPTVSWGASVYTFGYDCDDFIVLTLRLW